MTLPTRLPRHALCIGLAMSGLAACNDDDGDPEDYEATATLEVKDYVAAELAKLTAAASELQAAAPDPDDDGWNEDNDADAVEAMRTAWGRARDAYEHIEGSIAVLFPELDVSTDERYDGFIETDPDDNLFDDEGVTGVHGIERILWAKSAPERVVRFERALTHYKAAAFPATREEADDFKNKLTARLVADTEIMHDEFEPTALGADTAFRGMIGSMQEQSEKTTKAAGGEDESRYAQRTLADMRANLRGAEAVFEAFRPWIEATGDQSAEIQARFEKVGDAYAAVSGDALPEVPEGFDPDDPSDADLASPYGKLWTLLNEETDIRSETSAVSIMTAAGDDMGIARFDEE